jgi:uncharacterized membrane protein (DUF4010 family)
MSDSNVEILIRLGLAFAIGLLIGFERGWAQRETPEGERVAGFRTFGLVGLLGALAVTIAPGDSWLLAALALAIGGLAAIGYSRLSEREHGRGVTGMIALLVTFALGALAGRGHLEASASAAVIVTLLLGFKPELHEVVRRIERQELLGTIRLLLISVVILPVLPDRGFGPWQALTILLAATVNTLVKSGIAIAIGGWRLGLRVLVPMTLALAGGALPLLALPR